MFGFFKRKIEEVVNKFSKDVEEESEVVESPQIEETPEEEIQKEVAKKDKKQKTEKSKPEKSKKVLPEPVDDDEEVVDNDEDENLVDDEDIGGKDVDEEILKSKVVEVEIPKKAQDKKTQETEVVKSKVEVKHNKQILAEPELDSEIESELKDEDVHDEEEKPKKRGFFSKITETFTKIKLSEEKFEELFWDLEIALLENNVAHEVIQKIKSDLKEELTQEKISRKGTHDIILDSLRKSIEEVLSVEEIDLLEKINEKKPYIIAVIGVNGSGKTTTIAKLCNYLKKHNKTVVLAAADTFRAAAIQQIEHHAQNLDIKLIKHDYNSDPSAVAFDAIRHAEAKGLDVVVIDTAGRLHSNDNLMNELKKLVRVNKPDLKLFVGESITGNDCVEQAKKYDEIIGIDAIILSKADVDDKGGAALSISYVTKKPLLFIGTGQNYEDLEIFNKDKIISKLGI